MRVIILLTAYAMLHDCVMGCGSNEPAKVAQPNAAAQKNQEDKLWTLCCMARGTTNIRGCVSRNVNDTATTIPDCDKNDEMVVFLTCLEHSDPCSISMDLDIYDPIVFYKEKQYATDWKAYKALLIIMLNKVERSKFFVKTTDQMRQLMVANKSANAGESNYWIGLDMMYILTHLDKRAGLKFYVNATSFFTGRYYPFEVEDFSEKFIFFTTNKFVGKSDLNQFDPSNSLTPINSTFLGSENFNVLCDELQDNIPTSWWYGHNSDGDRCSYSILTTEDGKYGWGKDVIQAAIMAIDFF